MGLPDCLSLSSSSCFSISLFLSRSIAYSSFSCTLERGTGIAEGGGTREAAEELDGEDADGEPRVADTSPLLAGGALDIAVQLRPDGENAALLR
jgi:hypothetical protein